MRRSQSQPPTRAPLDQVRPAGPRGWRGRPLIALGLAVATLMAFAAPSAQAQQGSVSGTVQIEGALRPLSGAQVTVEGQPGKQAVTDASGRFRIAAMSGARGTLSRREEDGWAPMTKCLSVVVALRRAGDIEGLLEPPTAETIDQFIGGSQPTRQRARR